MYNCHATEGITLHFSVEPITLRELLSQDGCGVFSFGASLSGTGSNISAQSTLCSLDTL